MSTDKWSDYFMDIAKRTAQLSHCKKLQVGAIAVRDRRVICTGYNGMPPGADNCCEYVVGHDALGPLLQTKPDVEHAERNLIAYAARQGIALLDAELYITHAPCIDCSRMIFNAGFTQVFWSEVYRCVQGLRYLEDRGLRVVHL